MKMAMPLIWFAIWNPNRGLAIAFDVTSDEVEPWRARVGNSFAGLFASRGQAEVFAIERLALDRSA
jgi:hypothetical protein